MFERKADLLHAMAQPTRLKILALLGGGDRCVCELQAGLGEAQPTVSRHLAILRRAGIVRTRRARNRVVYGLSDPRVARLLEQVETLVGAARGGAQHAFMPIGEWITGSGRPQLPDRAWRRPGLGTQRGANCPGAPGRNRPTGASPIEPE